LDEADVMLQMGFQNTLNAIMKNLPQCQTMLFSATLSNQIHSLASMSMNNPERIFLNAIQAANESSFSTPHNLTQYYMETEPYEKINTIFSFLKTHKKQKVIIFLSTCKQVRYMYEALKKFKLGTPLFELQGHQKQKKRMAIYFTFTEKKFGILLCTNIAARGLDFPAVDFVIQADTAENVETYIHRVGRTARFRSEGKGLALVSKGEQAFIHQLKEKGI
jgi:ATP-dependent RNA helicase DDX10/DBP4